MAKRNQTILQWRAEGTSCYYCGKFIIGARVTADHIIPKAKGGSGKIENLVPSCQDCNHLKGTLTTEEFMDKLKSLIKIEKGVLFMKNLKVIANELVAVYENENKERVINARELYEFLSVASRYNDWIKNRLEKYGFEEEQDYMALTKNLVSGGKETIHWLKIDCAKEIAMVENNDQGRKVRQYFIAVERKAREMLQVPKTLPEALRLAADLAEQIQKNKPKVLFADKCLKSNDSILIRELAKIAFGNGIDIGEHRLFKKLREWGILNANNEPYQKYIESGYFEIVQRSYETEYGTRLTMTTKVLPKGQEYILNRLAS